MPEPNDELKDEVRALLDEGRKIEAIKRVREETGYSLLEAKNYVEAFARGETASAGSGGDFEEELVALLRQGKKIEAVQHFRQETGAGLKDAYDAMRVLASRHGIEWRSGCAAALVLAACGLGVYLLT